MTVYVLRVIRFGADDRFFENESYDYLLKMLNTLSWDDYSITKKEN